MECNRGWSICRNGIVLSARLRLGPAITLAPALARDEHDRALGEVSVMLPGADEWTPLDHDTSEAAAA